MWLSMPAAFHGITTDLLFDLNLDSKDQVTDGTFNDAVTEG